MCNHCYAWQPIALAAALYAQALADAPRRGALLTEAVDAAATPLKPLREIRRWRERIRQAQL